MADKNIAKREAHARRKYHIRKRVSGTAERPRLVVYRSLKHMYVQFIDDDASRTLMAVSTLSAETAEKIKKAKSKVDVGFQLGMIAGELAKKNGIEKVVFDRGGYLFTGRVKAVADGARKAGLQF
jgi:large subunit ribosomal protein L18